MDNESFNTILIPRDINIQNYLFITSNTPEGLRLRFTLPVIYQFDRYSRIPSASLGDYTLTLAMANELLNIEKNNITKWKNEPLTGIEFDKLSNLNLGKYKEIERIYILSDGYPNLTMDCRIENLKSIEGNGNILYLGDFLDMAPNLESIKLNTPKGLLIYDRYAN